MSGSANGKVTALLELPAGAVTVQAAPPELLSQLNVLQVTGIPRKAFLELLRAPGFPLTVSRLGHLRLVDRVEFVAWLRQRPAPAAPVPANDAAGTPAEDGSEALLRELGCERVQPKARARAR